VTATRSGFELDSLASCLDGHVDLHVAPTCEGARRVLPGCSKDVLRTSQGCYKERTKALRECSKNDKIMLQEVSE
jgi:hypothetical protein